MHREQRRYTKWMKIRVWPTVDINKYACNKKTQDDSQSSDLLTLMDVSCHSLREGTLEGARLKWRQGKWGVGEGHKFVLGILGVRYYWELDIRVYNTEEISRMEIQTCKSFAHSLKMRRERESLGPSLENATFSGWVEKYVSAKEVDVDRWMSQRQKGQERSKLLLWMLLRVSVNEITGWGEGQGEC